MKPITATCDRCGPSTKALWRSFNMDNSKSFLDFCNHCYKDAELKLRAQNFITVPHNQPETKKEEMPVW